MAALATRRATNSALYRVSQMYKLGRDCKPFIKQADVESAVKTRAPYIDIVSTAGKSSLELFKDGRKAQIASYPEQVTTTTQAVSCYRRMVIVVPNARLHPNRLASYRVEAMKIGVQLYPLQALSLDDKLDTWTMVVRGTISFQELAFSLGHHIPFGSEFPAFQFGFDEMADLSTLGIKASGKVKKSIADFLLQKVEGFPSLLAQINDQFKSDTITGNKPLHIGGHSLGAAIAPILAILAKESGKFGDITVFMVGGYSAVDKQASDSLATMKIAVSNNQFVQDPVPLMSRIIAWKLWDPVPGGYLIAALLQSIHFPNLTEPIGDIHQASLAPSDVNQPVDGHELTGYRSLTANDKNFALRDQDPQALLKEAQGAGDPEKVVKKISEEEADKSAQADLAEMAKDPSQYKKPKP